MDIFSSEVSFYGFMLFVFSGFVTVWVFRYFRGITKSGEFELFGLSVFWGIINVMIWQLLTRNKPDAPSLIDNPVAAGVALAVLGTLVGLMGNWISRSKWFKTCKDFIGWPFSSRR